jgi:cytoskeletal protein CcmA (bactofilin family)
MDDKKRFKLGYRFKQAGLFLASIVLLPLLFTLMPASSWSNVPENQASVTIGAQEVINDDLYLSAETVTIDGTVKGDAVVAATQITLNGTVEGDLIAVGRIITVNGTVNDDV